MIWCFGDGRIFVLWWTYPPRADLVRVRGSERDYGIPGRMWVQRGAGNCPGFLFHGRGGATADRLKIENAQTGPDRNLQSVVRLSGVVLPSPVRACVRVVSSAALSPPAAESVVRKRALLTQAIIKAAIWHMLRARM